MDRDRPLGIYRRRVAPERDHLAHDPHRVVRELLQIMRVDARGRLGRHVDGVLRDYSQFFGWEWS